MKKAQASEIGSAMFPFPVGRADVRYTVGDATLGFFDGLVVGKAATARVTACSFRV